MWTETISRMSLYTDLVIGYKIYLKYIYLNNHLLKYN
jgi:hypothetical protein